MREVEMESDVMQNKKNPETDDYGRDKARVEKLGQLKL